MEKCVDSEYQNDSSKSPQTWAIPQKDNSNNSQEIKSEAAGKASRPRKKIALEKRPVGRTDPGKAKASGKTDKLSNEESKRVRKLSVLKSKLVTGRRSVQNNTKTLHRIVPDRIGKYINSNVRREAKLSGRSSTAKSSNDCSREIAVDSVEHSDMSRDCSGTKLIATANNECLNETESGTLGNRIGSESGTENIFEEIFRDCLGSTSVVNDASSRGALNLGAGDGSAAVNPEKVEKYALLLENVENFEKDDARMIENEKTPVKDDRFRLPTPDAPVKTKDHDNYYTHNKIRHVCGYCHKIFKSNGKLNSHVYSHTGERPFDCNNCGKAFSSKFKLVRHLLIHSEIRKFVCQICDRTFLRNDHLKNHYKIHDPQKKMYKCPKEDCDKEYSSVMSHKKHMAFHSVEDGDLKCLICSVKFETKEEILFHLKSHSGSRLFKTQSDKKFKCDFCDRLFLTRKDVTRHLVVHTGERDFLCQFCPQRFGRKDHLVRHIKKSHLNDDMAVKRELIEKKEVVPKTRPPPPPATSTSRSEPEEQEEEVEDEEEDEEEMQEEQQRQQQQEQLQPQEEDVVEQEKAQEQEEEEAEEKEEGEEEEEGKEVEEEEEEEEEEEDEEDEAGVEGTNQKTHIVITVKSPMQKKKWKSDSSAKSKSFRKDPSVPKKKQVPLSKNKNSTTQIFLQNIPNILIIPNNSIILLRNQGSSSKAKKTEVAEGRTGGNVEENTDTVNPLPTYDNQDRFQYPEDVASKPVETETGEPNSLMDTDPSVNYNCNMFQQPQFPNNFPFEVDNLGNFQPDVTTFDQPPEDINFDLMAASELLKKGDPMTDPQEMAMPGSPSQADLQRKIGVVKPMTKNIPDEIAKDLFEEGSEGLSLSESILNDFKIDDSIILDNDGGILNNLFGQSGVEASGNEFLRSLLMNDSPMVSPLPGFSQIFNHNAN